jgi:hypothetical protein
VREAPAASPARQQITIVANRQLWLGTCIDFSCRSRAPRRAAFCTKGSIVKKRTYEISLIGLGVFAVAALAFGVAHRAGKTRQDASESRERAETRDGAELDELASAEGEALSSPLNELPPTLARAESLPRDEAMAEIWDTELPGREREEMLALSGDLASELETRGDTYDGIEPEDLGAEWLARATEAPLPHHTAPHRSGALDVEALVDANEERALSDIDDDDLGRA